MKCGNRNTSFFHRIIVWVPALFLLFTLSWSYYVYVYEFCINVVLNCNQKNICLITYHCLLVLFLFSFGQAVSKKIDKFPEQHFLDELHLSVDQQSRNVILERFVKERNLKVDLRNCNGGYIFCFECKAIKPDRAHHCSVCRRCVLRMDHHCFWLNTCISFRNYKYFLLVLLYGLALCFFVFISILPYYIAFLSSKNNLNGNVENSNYTKLNVLLLFFASGMFLFPVLGMAYEHICLMTNNETTIETLQTLRFQEGEYCGAYDLGVIQNFRQVFGRYWILWFMPVFSSLGNGVEYARQNYLRDTSALA